MICEIAQLDKKGVLLLIIIDKQSRVPVYEQIKNQIITLISVGVFAPHSKLPSIRNISAETAVNVNTVKKAFAELELSGVIYTVPGTGSFVSENALESNSYTVKVIREITDSVTVAKSIGVSFEKITEIIEKIYKEDEK